MFATLLHEMTPTRVAIALADSQPATRNVARNVAAQLRARGLATQVTEWLAVPPADVSALVLGTSGSPASLASVAQLVNVVRPELAGMPTALFVVRHGHARDPMLEIHDVVDRLHWRPDLVAALGSDEPHHGQLLRWVVHHLRPQREWSVTTTTDAARLADAISVGLRRADELHLLQAHRGAGHA